MVEEHFGDKAYGFEVIYVSLLLLAVYAAVLALVARRKIPRVRIAYALLCLVVTGEMLFHAGGAFRQAGFPGALYLPRQLCGQRCHRDDPSGSGEGGAARRQRNGEGILPHGAASPSHLCGHSAVRIPGDHRFFLEQLLHHYPDDGSPGATRSTVSTATFTAPSSPRSIPCSGSATW